MKYFQTIEKKMADWILKLNAIIFVLDDHVICTFNIDYDTAHHDEFTWLCTFTLIMDKRAGNFSFKVI